MTTVDLTSSPFHEGEERVQARQGVLEKAASFGPKLIRDHLIDQHREFYAQLPFLLLGTVDERGGPGPPSSPARPGSFQRPTTPPCRSPHCRLKAIRWAPAWRRARRWAFWACSWKPGGATA